MSDSSYLSIKWISLQLIHTLEVMSVALRHHQTVLVSLEEVSLVQHFKSISSEFSLPLYIYESAPLPLNTKPSGFLLISVEIDNQGKPKSLNLILRKSIEIRLRL